VWRRRPLGRGALAAPAGVRDVVDDPLEVRWRISVALKRRLDLFEIDVCDKDEYLVGPIRAD
jgi:hypothetical protein